MGGDGGFVRVFRGVRVRIGVRLRTRVRRTLVAGGAVAALLGGGLLAGGAQPAQAATSVPSWLVGFETQNLNTGAYRACTAIRLTGTRVLTSPDCFTGRTGNDITWSYRGSSQFGGTGYPIYRTPPQYNAQTRQGAFAVATVLDLQGSGTPVVAGPADAALFASGAKATFYSWAGPTGEGTTRHQHSEQVAILSTSTCTKQLGYAPPAGTFCTLPVTGTAAPAPADQCLGDAGGALVAGGKLIGVSATASAKCVSSNGVRQYTKAASYRTQIVGWGRDTAVNPDYAGSVTSLQTNDFGGLVGWCYIDPDKQLTGCAADVGEANYYDLKFNFFTQAGDLDGDGDGELLARTPGGALYSYSPDMGDSDLDTAPKKWLGNGWGGYNAIFSVRDFSGDGFPDLITRDTSGNLWLYRGNGKGGYSARTSLATGFRSYNLITGRGDLSGDGLADVVTRDTSGNLWLFRGNGKGGFAPRTKLGSGFSGYREIVASGDMDNDGRQDLLGRTPGGGVFLLNALPNAAGLTSPHLYTKTSWKPFTRIA